MLQDIRIDKFERQASALRNFIVRKLVEGQVVQVSTEFERPVDKSKYVMLSQENIKGSLKVPLAKGMIEVDFRVIGYEPCNELKEAISKSFERNKNEND